MGAGRGPRIDQQVPAMRAHIDAAGTAQDRKGVLFHTSRGHRGV
jgi:hypothetical protein